MSWSSVSSSHIILTRSFSSGSSGYPRNQSLTETSHQQTWYKIWRQEGFQELNPDLKIRICKEILQPAEVLQNRWKIIRKIGAGGFGVLFEGLDLITQEQVALKVETSKQPQQVLKKEIFMLKALQGQGPFCNYVGCGRNQKYSFLAMQLQGKDLATLQRAQPSAVFSLPTALRLTLQVLKYITILHKTGYLHRDIKPANFVMGRLPMNCRKVYMIDFGLCRQYKTPTGEVRAPRAAAGFRGTVRYASINAHKKKELGPHDDLWSFIYMISEFMNGQLPWSKIEDEKLVTLMKQNCDVGVLLHKFPPELLILINHIQSLDYEAEPDYTFMIALIQQAIKNEGIEESDPYDWETDTNSAVPDNVLPAATTTPDNVLEDSNQENIEPDNSHELEDMLNKHSNCITPALESAERSTKQHHEEQEQLQVQQTQKYSSATFSARAVKIPRMSLTRPCEEERGMLTGVLQQCCTTVPMAVLPLQTYATLDDVAAQQQLPSCTPALQQQSKKETKSVITEKLDCFHHAAHRRRQRPVSASDSTESPSQQPARQRCRHLSPHSSC